VTLAHWDDVEKVRREFGHIRALWTNLGDAAAAAASASAGSSSRRALEQDLLRGLGLIARLEPLDYFDGEPA